jgi:hypothetical protein
VAYDLALAERVRSALASRADVVEMKMFGGIAFMVGGHMACGIVGEDLMVRVGPEAHAAALAQPHVRPMDFSGRPMRGYVYIDPDGLAADVDLVRWVERGASFARTLPPK